MCHVLHWLEKPACLSGHLTESTPIRAFLDICWKSRFVCGLEDLDFLHSEHLRACEEVLDAIVVRARAVKIARV
jgi:hypothetical protein